MTTLDADGNAIPIIGTYCGKAAKDYQCDACSKLIFKGESYIRIVIKPGGEFQSRHYHYSCA